jgi:hypothetical protein
VTGYGTPTGSVTFTLHEGSCAGPVKYTQTVPLSGGNAATANPGTPGGGFTASGNTTWYWEVSYPGDANNAPSTSCVETTKIAE